MKPKKKGGGSRKPCAVAVLAILALWLGVSAAHAEDRSWADPLRLSAGLQGGYAWHTGDVSSLPPVEKEFQIGLTGAYNIVPGLSVTGYAVRGFENRTWRASLGPSARVWESPDRNHSAAVGLAYAWHAGPVENLPRFRHEWEANAKYGFRFSPRVILGGSSAVGLDSKLFRSVIGLTYELTH